MEAAADQISSTATAGVDAKGTLTKNPQDNTEIPSLFQTFSPNDQSGDDDDDEDLGGDYDPSFTSSSKAGAAASPPAGRHQHSLSDARSGAAAVASLNTSRNRHPMSRSTHNPYVHLSSADGTLYGPDMSPAATASSSAIGRSAHRYSFNNSTSQNPLTFEFNSSTTNVEGGNLAGSSSTLAANGGGIPMRRQLSQLQQARDSSSEVADGYWRDGNPMSMSSTDLTRPMNTTSVCTLSSGAHGETQTIIVNVRQRIRPAANSRTSSLNTSLATLPVVLPGAGLSAMEAGSNSSASSLSIGQLQAAALGSSESFDTRQHSGMVTSTPVVANMNSAVSCGGVAASVTPNTGNERPPTVTVPSSAVEVMEPVSSTGVRNRQPESSHPPSPQHRYNEQQLQQQQMYAGYQHPSYAPSGPMHPNSVAPQSYYSYGVQEMSSPQSPYGQVHFGASPYNGMAPHPGYYQHPAAGAYPQAPPPQQQQQQSAYYDPRSQHGMPMMHGGAGATGGGYVAADPYRPVHAHAGAQLYMHPTSPGPMTPMGTGYGYSPHAPMNSTAYGAMTQVAVGSNAGYGEDTMHRNGQQASHGHSYASTGEPPSLSSGGEPSFSVEDNSTSGSHSPSGGSGAGRPQGRPIRTKRGTRPEAPPQDYVAPAQSQKRAPAPAAVKKSDAASPAVRSHSPTNLSGTASPVRVQDRVSGVAKKLPKRPDEARFHILHDAPIRLFVVVRRKMEGQRYACALAPEQVPVGSQMLVEGDRGADLGEVLAHISLQQMAHDCAIVAHRHRAALAKMHKIKVGAAGEVDTSAEQEADLEVAPRSDEEALAYVTSVKSWPWLIGPATAEDVASVGPQRQAEKLAFATAQPIVQQFIENRFQQRVERNEQAKAANSGAVAGPASTEKESPDVVAAATATRGQSHAGNSEEDEDAHASVTPLTADELQTLELSRQVQLVDCEYQFTREKLTLFVSRPSRSIFVDFRRMQRKLFRTFRCRIWIAYLDEVADDEDAPESFVFVPPPASALGGGAAPTKEESAAVKA